MRGKTSISLLLSVFLNPLDEDLPAELADQMADGQGKVAALGVSYGFILALVIRLTPLHFTSL